MTTPSWEEALVADYTDLWWHRIMEPLCDALQRWKSGQAEHSEADKAVEAAYHERCALNSLIRQRPDRAAAIIQVVDNEWFARWLGEHRHSAPGSTQAT